MVCRVLKFGMLLVWCWVFSSRGMVCSMVVRVLCLVWMMCMVRGMGDVSMVISVVWW